MFVGFTTPPILMDPILVTQSLSLLTFDPVSRHPSRTLTLSLINQTRDPEIKRPTLKKRLDP